MNYTIPNPNGLDYYVQRLQTRLYEYLLNRWGLSGTPNLYKQFGRVYRINSETGYVPMAKLPDVKDYVSSNGRGSNGALFFEDSLAAMSYFYVLDPIKKTNLRDDMAMVELYFFIDLSKITAGGISQTDAAGQRLDEIAIDDVENFVNNNGCGFSPMDKTRDVDKVLEKFSGSLKKDALNDDMNPRLCFKLTLQAPYNPVLFQTTQQKQLQPMDKLIVLYTKASPDLTKKIAVGNGQYIYQEYAEGNTLTPVLFGTSTPYLAGKNMLLFTYNNSVDLVASWDTTTGAWTRTGLPYGFNDGDFSGILFTDLV